MTFYNIMESIDYHGSWNIFESMEAMKTIKVRGSYEIHGCHEIQWNPLIDLSIMESTEFMDIIEYFEIQDIMECH